MKTAVLNRLIIAPSQRRPAETVSRQRSRFMDQSRQPLHSRHAVRVFLIGFGEKGGRYIEDLVTTIRDLWLHMKSGEAKTHAHSPVVRSHADNGAKLTLTSKNAMVMLAAA